jgi:ACT domain-containing protein
MISLFDSNLLYTLTAEEAKKLSKDDKVHVLVSWGDKIYLDSDGIIKSYDSNTGWAIINMFNLQGDKVEGSIYYSYITRILEDVNDTIPPINSQLIAQIESLKIENDRLKIELAMANTIIASMKNDLLSVKSVLNKYN